MEVPRRVVVTARPGDTQAQNFVDRFDGTPFEFDIEETESPDDLDRVVGAAVERGVDAIAAVGGDGALNLVVGSLAAAGSAVPVVPVRGGTVNLMTQVLGLESLDDAADALRSARVRSIDLGRTEAGFFIMNASTGYDAAVIGDAADHSDAKFGRLRFLAEGVQRLRRDSPRKVVVRVDGDETYRGRAMSVIVFNVGRRVSDGFAVAPDASFDDGLLDVAVVRVASLRRMVATIARLAVGHRVPSADVTRAQGSRIEVEWESAVPSQRDGDVDEPATTVVAQVRPGALRIHHGIGEGPESGTNAPT